MTQPHEIEGQGQSYRRGLLLGLTMAEIMLLIIFILLLALASLLLFQKEKEEKLLEQTSNLSRQVLTLREQVHTYESITEGRSDLVQELAQLRVMNRQQEAMLEQFEADAEAFAELEAALKSVGVDIASGTLKKDLSEFRELKIELDKTGLSSQPKQLAQILQSSNDLVMAAKEAGVEPTSESLKEAFEERAALKGVVADMGGSDIVEALKENRELEREVERMKGQQANMQLTLERLGRGTEKPSCWADSDGSVEFIYEIALTSNGVILRETDLPHRKDDRMDLPVGEIPLMQDISERAFLAVTRPLYEWSESKECRFFARVYDQTDASAKELYKNRLKAVQGSMYTYESREQF
ncbi:hypothetical protein [Thalassospira profundimaris]|uniref:Uncharacterized protein n=1 Tax=Thalassospira profundimaris TaxID=502049 RepID=A0A367WXC2_9PROT|nr:hypothetical protein [Thalassospira profundimaris]RCK46095.1 hypothetical protein TH30_09705 [Thalassospira profundimaris]